MQRILEAGQIESLDHSSIPRVRLPERYGAFGARATRMRRLAANSVAGIPVEPALGGYLNLMGRLADAQQGVLNGLTDSDVGPLDHDMIARSQAHSMPVLPASGPRQASWHVVFDRLLGALTAAADAAGANGADSPLGTTLRALQALSPAERDAAADAVLTGLAAPDAATAPFLFAALQVWWTERASRLQVTDIPYMEHPGLCPVCGSQPVASVVRIGGASQNYRYLQCGLCTTEFHMVRVKCTNCESTDTISYNGIVETGAPDVIEDAGAPGGKRPAADPAKFAKAETCGKCHCYRKIFYQEHDYDTEPLADDLASLSLDVLMTEAGYERISGNPLFWLDDATS
ncbi:formate dehydrogenase accessory protein FdhE [Robbsia sp. Bb-Pol-6]|uniref:Formate dehydrogenase accessory protein FdhE n=1 Tax=Robbsia betulipollinis TaxID=2981849 RepID=A0ABT3ZH39_9BURK|nr:formate dehydrogenase accessory protein FdhE [Robbsia betulipollinis]